MVDTEEIAMCGLQGTKRKELATALQREIDYTSGRDLFKPKLT